MKIFDKPYKPARISQGKKEWYVYYSFLNPTTRKWDLFKDRAGLNYIKDLRARLAAAEVTRDAYNERLKGGWSPFGASASPEYETLKFEPIEKVLERLLAIKENSIKRRSYQSYKYSNAVLTTWLKKQNLQDLSIENFTSKHARLFADDLQKSEYSNKSINNHIEMIGVMFNAAIERDLIIKNPFKKISKLPEESGKNFPFSEVQKQALKKKILEYDPPMWFFVKCIYHLFVRPIELLQVKIGDIDLRTNQIIMQSGNTKNMKQLPVEIPESFIDEIKELKLDQYPANYFLFGRGMKPGPLSMKRNTVSARHTKILKGLNMDGDVYTLYGWKHTGNIDAYLAGVDVYDLMRQNRHHSLEQTMKYLRSLGLRPNVNFSKKAPKL